MDSEGSDQAVGFVVLWLLYSCSVSWNFFVNLFSV